MQQVYKKKFIEVESKSDRIRKLDLVKSYDRLTKANEELFKASSDDCKQVYFIESSNLSNFSRIIVHILSYYRHGNTCGT